MLPERNGDWILTHTGIQFYPLDPREEEVSIEDIAHALSLQCRFAGHCAWHYSVAQHSLIVSHLVPDNPLWGLLHDAAEAYLVDLPRPIKRYSDLGDAYRRIEHTLEICIANRFGLALPMPESVKLADDRVLMTEKRDIMPGPEKPWRETAIPLPGAIMRLHPGEAERLFLARFSELFHG